MGKGNGIHVDEACHAALEVQTMKNVGADLAAVGGHDGDEARYVPADQWLDWCWEAWHRSGRGYALRSWRA